MIQTAPRIYNIHPLLAGPIDAWSDHLPRVRAMGFDWVYVNAFFATGSSGSIYAVADPRELHARVRGRAEAPAAELVRRFVDAAAARGPARHDGPDPAARGSGRAPRRRTSRLVPPRSRRGARRANSRQPQRSKSAALHGGPGGARPRRASPPPGPARLLRRSGAPLALGRHSGFPLQRRLQGAAGVLARASGTAARGLPRCRLPGRSVGLSVRADADARRLRLRSDLRQQQMVGLPPALVPRPIRRAAPHSAHGRLPGGPQHAAARGRSGRHRAPGDRRALPCPLSGNARARLRDDDADGLRVRLSRAARSGRDHARELGTRDQGAASRPAGLHRCGASRQGRDAGP